MIAGNQELRKTAKAGVRRHASGMVRRLLLGLLGLVVTFYAVCVLSFIGLRWIAPPTSSVQVQRRIEAVLARKPYTKRYTFVPLSRISHDLQHAVIAAEDGRFYRHHGIDWTETQKVVEKGFEEGHMERGASTITQQLVKNLFLILMPYCYSCGQQVAPTDIYCAKCGNRQPVTPPRPSPAFSDITPRTASMLCYIPVAGWIPAIIVLASQRFRNDRIVRFHAFQGIYIFVAWLLVDWVVRPMLYMLPGPHLPFISTILKLVLFLAWGIMLVKTSQEQFYSLPIVGELAQRSVAEH